MKIPSIAYIRKYWNSFLIAKIASDLHCFKPKYQHVFCHEWLVIKGLRFCFDLGMLKVGDVQAYSGEFIHNSSIVRMSK